MKLFEHVNKMRTLIGAKHGVIKPLLREMDLPTTTKDTQSTTKTLNEVVMNLLTQIKRNGYEEKLRLALKALPESRSKTIPNAISEPSFSVGPAKFVKNKSYIQISYEIGGNDILDKTFIKFGQSFDVNAVVSKIVGKLKSYYKEGEIKRKDVDEKLKYFGGRLRDFLIQIDKIIKIVPSGTTIYENEMRADYREVSSGLEFSGGDAPGDTTFWVDFPEDDE